MITNKDISIDSENGKITLNGNKYDLGTQGEIDTAVKGVYSVMGQMGAKNLFNSQYSAPRTNAGTTATLGNDGHIIINGTANAAGAQLNQSVKAILPIYDLKVGDKLILSYKVISGTFTHGSSSDATTLFFINKNGSGVDPLNFPLSLSAGDSDSKEITLTDACFTDGILALKGIQIFMRSGDTFNNLELAIMLRLAADTDNTYEPYAMTNKQLTYQLGTKQDTLTFDTTPTDESTNPVTSGGVYTADKAISDTIGDITQTGVTGATVAAQIETVGDQIEGLTATTLTGIDILSYNSDSNQYTAPSDGYVRMELRNDTHYFYLMLNGSTMLGGEGHTVTNANDYLSVFVRKGTNIYYSGTVQTAIFYSLT